MTNARLFIGLATLALVASCKSSAPDSSVKTLNNLAAGGRLTTNSCSGKPADVKDAGEQLILKSFQSRIVWPASTPAGNRIDIVHALTDAFSAIPRQNQAMFLAMGGQVGVVTGTLFDDICSKNDATKGTANTNAQKDPLSGCYWYATADVASSLSALTKGISPKDLQAKYGSSKVVSANIQQGTAGQTLAIFVQPNALEIRHNFVRIFGMMLARIGGRVVTTDQTYTAANLKIFVSDTEDPAITQYKTDLGKAFLADLSGTPNMAAFQKFANGQGSELDVANFRDTVYGETYDSAHCNDWATDGSNTLKQALQSFPKTMEVYAQHERQSIAKKPRAAAGLALSDAGHGFALAGGSYSPWNPIGWVVNGATAVKETVQGTGILYNQAAEQIQQSVQNQTEQMTQYNGGTPPSFLQNASIALQAAAGQGANVPLVGGAISILNNGSAAVGGASIDSSGQGTELSTGERFTAGGKAALDTALNFAPIPVGKIGSGVASTGEAVAGDVLEMGVQTGSQTLGKFAFGLENASGALREGAETLAPYIEPAISPTVDLVKETVGGEGAPETGAAPESFPEGGVPE